MRNLSGKTIFDLDAEDFRLLFCRICKYQDECHKHSNENISECRELVDNGSWYRLCRT